MALEISGNNAAGSATGGLKVRKATRNDYAALREVATISRKEAFAHFMDDNEIAAEIERYYNDSVMDEIVSNPANAIFVAENEGRILGYICVLPQDRKGRPRLLQFYVHPQAQRQGVGSILFKQGCAFLKDAGQSEVFISTVRANKIGLDFFAKHGCTLIYDYSSTWDGVTHDVTVFHRQL